PEVPRLQHRVVSVPEGQRETETLVIVRDAAQAVLSPAVPARLRVVEGKVFPGRALRRVVLANRPPLTLGQIRSPSLPVGGPLPVLLESPLPRAAHLDPGSFTGSALSTAPGHGLPGVRSAGPRQRSA